MVVLVDLSALIIVCIGLLYVGLSIWEAIEANKRTKLQKEKDKREDAEIQSVLLDLFTKESKHTIKELLESKPQNIILSAWVKNVDTFSKKYDIGFSASRPQPSTIEDLKTDMWK